MNQKMDAKTFGSVSAEIDTRLGEPLIAIANCAPSRQTHGCLWFDEEQATWLRDWLSECLQSTSSSVTEGK